MKRSLIFIFFIFYIITVSNAQKIERGRGDSLAIPKDIKDKLDFQGNKLNGILETLYLNYDESFDSEKLSEQGFNAMLQNLDRFSIFVSKEQYKAMMESQDGKNIGIGAELLTINDTLTVIGLQYHSPAIVAGLRIGDKILKIDTSSVLKLNGNDANLRLKGDINTFVELTVKRGFSDKFITLKIERETVDLPSVVLSYMIPKTDIAYLKLLRFSMKSYDEVMQNLDMMKKQGMKNLIIDLRGNPGGALDIVIKICNEFLQEGDTISYTKAKNKDYQYTFIADGKGKYKKIPIVAIVDENTASASEILCGMLQDLDRGIVIGKNTVGKGLVQKYWEMTDKSAFRITVAKYFTPLGRLIQKDPFNMDNIDPALRLSVDPKNLESIKELMKLTGGKSRIPIFYTKKKRPMFEFGGIFPDIRTPKDTTTLLTQVLKSNGIFLLYSYDYIYKNRDSLVSIYGDSYLSFDKTFNVDDNFLSHFEKFSRTYNIWNDTMFASDKEYIANFIKALIGHAIWGDEAFYYIGNYIDNDLKKAIESMKNAQELLN